MGQLTDTVQKLQRQNLALMAKINNVEKENKDPSSSKTNELLTQLLAQGNNKCLVAPPQDSKVAELEKQLAEARKAASKKNNSTKAKWESRKVTWNKYCSSCGITWDHENDNCNNKQSWHKQGATYENKMGGSTMKEKLWGKTTSCRFKVTS